MASKIDLLFAGTVLSCFVVALVAILIRKR